VARVARRQLFSNPQLEQPFKEHGMKRILIPVAFTIAAGSVAPSYAGRDGADLMLQEKAKKEVIAQRKELEELRRKCAAAPQCQTGAAPAASGGSVEAPAVGEKR
jgi:hypothetical protein